MGVIKTAHVVYGQFVLFIDSIQVDKLYYNITIILSCMKKFVLSFFNWIG